MSALRSRVCLVRPLSRATVRTFSAPSLFSASSRPAARVTPARPPSSAASTPPRRAFRAGARETRGVPRAAGEPPADGWDASPSSTRTSDEPTPAEIPVSFSRDEEDAEASAGEGSSGHDVVGDAREPSSKANETSETSEPLTGPTPTGWDTKPTSIVPNAYFQGEVGYSKFYPPEARDYEYKRKLVVAVDGSLESERAVEWAIQHLCRSGDLLQIVHCCLAGAIDPRLASYYNGPSLMSGDQIRADPRLSVQVNARPEYPERFPKRPMYDDSWAPTHLKEVRVRFFFDRPASGRNREANDRTSVEFERTSDPIAMASLHASALGALFNLPRKKQQHVPVDLFADPKLQDAYWSAAVLRTEAMLDDVYKKLRAKHGTSFDRRLEARPNVSYFS